jgi:hypothetical protein
MDKPHTMQTTQALNLDKISEKEFWALVDHGHITRRMGALPGFSNREYWALTAIGERAWYLV